MLIAAVVLVMFESDPAWLLVLVAFLVPLSIDAAYRALVTGGAVAPAIGRPIFAACYLAAFYGLRARSSSADSLSRTAAVRA